MRKIILPLLLAAAIAGPALAQSITQNVGVCDPAPYTHNCVKPNADGSVNVTGSITSSNPSVGANAATAPTSSTQIGSVDGTGKLQAASSSNPLPVTAASLPLPTGASTSANQTTANSSLSTIATNTTNAGTPTIHAGTNIIGKVGIDQTTPGTTNGVQTLSGSTTAVTQATGTNLHAVTDSGSTTAVTQATAANLNATVVGTGTFGVQASQSGTWNVTNVSGTVSLPTGAATSANQSTEITSLSTIATNSGTAATATNQQSNTNAGGATPVLENALSTTVKTVIGSAKVLESYYCYNPNAAVAYVQMFDSASVTLGTTTPVWSIGIPASGGANISNLGLSFANSIKVAATTTATGSTANASGVDCNFGYR